MFDFLPAALNFIGGMEQRASQEEMFHEGQNFNSAEAALARQFNSSEAGIGRDFNASEAGKSRDWQEEMSNSAYQRARKDMEAAGFNPMLAYMRGGAAVGSGGQASSGSASGPSANSPAAPHLENIAQGAVTSGMQGQLIGAQVEKAKAEARLANANAANEEYRPTDEGYPTARQSNIMNDTEMKRALANKTTAEIAKIEPEIRKILNEVNNIAMHTQLSLQQARHFIELQLSEQVRRGLMKAEEKHALASAMLTNYQATVEKQSARFADETGLLGPAIGSAAKAASIPFQLRPRIQVTSPRNTTVHNH